MDHIPLTRSYYSFAYFSRSDGMVQLFCVTSEKTHFVTDGVCTVFIMWSVEGSSSHETRIKILPENQYYSRPGLVCMKF